MKRERLKEGNRNAQVIVQKLKIIVVGGTSSAGI
jgi:hypothetical protein